MYDDEDDYDENFEDDEEEDGDDDLIMGRGSDTATHSHFSNCDVVVLSRLLLRTEHPKRFVVAFPSSFIELLGADNLSLSLYTVCVCVCVVALER